MIATASVYLISRLNDLAVLESRMRQYERGISEFQQRLVKAKDLQVAIEELERELSRAGHNLYAPGEMSLYQFGLQLNDYISSFGLEIVRYNPIGEGSRTLEYSLRGATHRALEFFQDIALTHPKWSIRQFTLITYPGEVELVLQLGYGVIDESSS